MGTRLLVSLSGVVLSLAAQDEPARIASPLHAVQAAPVAAPLRDGMVVEVVGEQGRPVAGALVGVLPAAWTAEQAALVAVLDRDHAEDPNARLAALLLRFGERFRCDADGRATVPARARHVAAVHEQHAGALELAGPPSGVVRIRLLPRAALLVRAVAADGKPAAEQRVAVVEGRHRDRDWMRTDAQGEIVLPLRAGFDRSDAAVVAWLAGASVRTVLPRGPLPRTPIELRLPATGMLRVIAYDDREQPRRDVVSVALRWQDVWPPHMVEPDAKGDVLVPVALGARFDVYVTLRGTTGAVSARCAGPTRAGELVVCDVRATQGPPVLVFRVLGVDGEPVRDASLHGSLGTGRTGGWQQLAVDADGCVRLTVTPGFPCERLVVTRRAPDLGRRAATYRGAAVVTVPARLQPGGNTLPDVRLGEEPVVARGVVVDDAGAPLAGVLVGAQLVFADEPGFHGDIESVRSDAAGRFEARDIRAAATVRVSTVEWPAGYEFASCDVPSGTTDARLVVPRQGRVQLQCAGVPETAHELLYADLVAPGAAFAGTGVRFVDGSVWLRKAAGTYDLVLGLRRDEMEVARIPGVVVRAGEATVDARLVPFPWRDVLRLVTVTAVDAAGAPVAEAFVWCVFRKPDGSGGGGGGQTDAQGRFVALVPAAGADIKVVPPVRANGPQHRGVELANCTTDQRVVLRDALHARVHLLGDRVVAGASGVQWSLQEHGLPFRGSRVRLGGAGQQPAADGTWDLHFEQPGTHDVVLRIDVPAADGTVESVSVLWGSITVVESADVQTFRLAVDEEGQRELAELRRRLRR